MPLPLNTYGLTRMFEHISTEASRKGFRVLTKVAVATERQAKLNLSYAPHKRGTPTPAVPGKGPGLISGTLRRAVTHTTPTPAGLLSWTAKVGLATGFTAPYGKTSAAVVGRILEKDGDRAGNKYPFLEPAAKFVHRIAAPVLYRDEFHRWPRMDY